MAPIRHPWRILVRSPVLDEGNLCLCSLFVCVYVSVCLYVCMYVYMHAKIHEYITYIAYVTLHYIALHCMALHCLKVYVYIYIYTYSLPAFKTRTLQMRCPPSAPYRMPLYKPPQSIHPGLCPSWRPASADRPFLAPATFVCFVHTGVGLIKIIKGWGLGFRVCLRVMILDSLGLEHAETSS